MSTRYYLFLGILLSANFVFSQEEAAPLDRLSRQLATLEKYVYNTDPSELAALKPEAQNLSHIDKQLSEIREEFSTVLDRLEKAEHHSQTLEKEIDKQAEKLKENVAQMKKQLDEKVETLAAKVQEAPPAPAAIEKPTDPQELYNLGRKFLEKAQHTEAQEVFEHFITTFPNHALIAAAYYWLGETQMALKNYSQAAGHFLKGYEQNPEGPKAPDNLLKLGMALMKLDKNTEACTTFRKLEKEFMGSTPAHGIEASATVKMIVERETKRLQCGQDD